MICFRDKTFCINENCTCDSDRKLTEEVLDAAAFWWGSKDAPIAVADLCQEPS